MACTVWPRNLPGQAVKGLRNQKQNVHWHRIQMRENGGSLNFIFISLPSPVGDENWVRWHIVCCAAHVWKMMPGTMFQSIKTFHEQQIHWTFPLSHTVALSLVIDTLSIRFSLLTGTSPMLHLFGSAFSMILISGVPIWNFGAQLDILFTIFTCSLSNCKYSYNQATPSFWLSVQILGYAVCILCTPQAKYVIFHVGWCKSQKGSATLDALCAYVCVCVCVCVCRHVCACMYMRACMCVNLPLTYSPTAAGVSRSGSTVMKIGCRFGRPGNESGHTHTKEIYI